MRIFAAATPPPRRLPPVSTGGRILAFLLATLSVAGLPAAETTPPPPRDLADLSLEELIHLKVGTVYAASRHWQDVSEAPAYVSIVTAEDVKLFGYRTLGDILRSVPNFTTSYDRNFTYLGVGGFNRPGDLNTRALVLIDGHRVNDNVTDSATVGPEFPLDIDLIDRVEVIRGPGASVYGNNAFFGVIHVITRTGRQMDGLEVSADGGSFASWKTRVSYGKLFTNGLELLLSGSYYQSDGPSELFYPYYESVANGGVAENRDPESFINSFARVSWRDFTLEGGWHQRGKGIPTGAYDTVFNDPRTETLDTRAWANLKFQRALPEDWEVTSRLYYDYYSQLGDYYTVEEMPPPPAVLNVDQFHGSRWGLEGQVSKRLFDRHTLTTGVEVRDNFQQDLHNHNRDPHEVFLDESRSSWNAGVFAQFEAALRTNLTLNAGLRYDYTSEADDNLNPRVALIWSPVPRANFKASYGSSFRDPNVAESFYNDGGITTKANPDLEPETIRTIQLVWEQDWGRQWRSVVGGFGSRIHDLISYTTDPSDGLLHYVNQDEVESAGGWLAVEKRFDFGLRARVSYTGQHARDADTGHWLENSPRHVGRLALDVPVWEEKLFAGLELHVQSASRTLEGGEADGFALVNFTLFSRRLVKNLEFSATVYNLFNADYAYPAGGEHHQEVIPQDGRTFRLKLTYRF